MANNKKTEIQLLNPEMDTETLLAAIAAAEGASIGAEGLLNLLWSADLRVFIRTCMAIGRIGDQKVAAELVNFLTVERSTVRRLCVLDALGCLAPPGLVFHLRPFLKEDDPLFLRGVVWLIGKTGGGESLSVLSDFLNTGRAQYLKDSLLAESFWLAAGGSRERLLRLAARDPVFARFAAHRRWPQRSLDYRYFDIYPYPDYLWQKAKKQGITRQQFKALMYRQRSKAARLPAACCDDMDSLS